jgi:hypothetical protein
MDLFPWLLQEVLATLVHYDRPTERNLLCANETNRNASTKVDFPALFLPTIIDKFLKSIW